jgi:hypothetical protein
MATINTTNAIDSKQKLSKINETTLYPTAHNGLVAGSNPALLARATEDFGGKRVRFTSPETSIFSNGGETGSHRGAKTLPRPSAPLGPRRRSVIGYPRCLLSCNITA